MWKVVEVYKVEDEMFYVIESLDDGNFFKIVDEGELRDLTTQRRVI